MNNIRITKYFLSFLGWAFGIYFIFLSFAFGLFPLLSTETQIYLAGVEAQKSISAWPFFFISLLLLPPARSFAYSITNKELPIIGRVAIIFVLIIIAGNSISQYETEKRQNATLLSFTKTYNFSNIFSTATEVIDDIWYYAKKYPRANTICHTVNISATDKYGNTRNTGVGTLVIEAKSLNELRNYKSISYLNNDGQYIAFFQNQDINVLLSSSKSPYCTSSSCFEYTKKCPDDMK